MRMYPRHPIMDIGSLLAVPCNDPLTASIDEYQAFLKTLGYSPLAKAAYGRKAR
jgi:hypothetical protein